jgi:hypothetical protein
MVIDEESVSLDGNFKLNRLEKVVDTRAGKNRDALSRTANVLFQVFVLPVDWDELTTALKQSPARI